MKKISRINAYQADLAKHSAIVVTTSPRENGWAVEVKFPQRTSGEDKIKLLNWMMDYRNKVKHQCPLWDVAFRSGENMYLLTVKPTKGLSDLKDLATDRVTGLFEYMTASDEG